MILISSSSAFFSTIYRFVNYAYVLMDGRRCCHYYRSIFFSRQCDFNKRNCVVKSPRETWRHEWNRKLRPQLSASLLLNEHRLTRFRSISIFQFFSMRCNRICRSGIHEMNLNSFKKWARLQLWIMSFSLGLFDDRQRLSENTRRRRFACLIDTFRYQSRCLFIW